MYYFENSTTDNNLNSLDIKMRKKSIRSFLIWLFIAHNAKCILCAHIYFYICIRLYILIIQYVIIVNARIVYIALIDMFIKSRMQNLEKCKYEWKRYIFCVHVYNSITNPSKFPISKCNPQFLNESQLLGNEPNFGPCKTSSKLTKCFQKNRRQR